MLAVSHHPDDASLWAKRIMDLEVKCKGLEAAINSQSNAISKAKNASSNDRNAAFAQQAETLSERQRAAQMDEDIREALGALDSARSCSTTKSDQKAQLQRVIEVSKMNLGNKLLEVQSLEKRIAEKRSCEASKKKKQELKRSLSVMKDDEAKVQSAIEDEKKRRQDLKDKTREWLKEQDNEEASLRKDIEAQISTELEAKLKGLRELVQSFQAEQIKAQQKSKECLTELLPRYCEDREVLLTKIREMTAQDVKLRDQLKQAEEELFQRKLRVKEREQRLSMRP